MRLLPTSPPLLTLALLITGCAGSSDKYPSLGVRDAERMQGSFTPAAPTGITPPPLDPARAASLPQILAAAREAHARFLGAIPAARSRVALGRGADVTSNEWAAAQVALADLESLRGQTAIALGDADLLLADIMLAGQDSTAPAATRAEIAALVDEEDRMLAGLRPAGN